MNLKSIHGRLNLFLLLGLGSLLVVSGLLLNAYLKQRFQSQFDVQVLGRAQMLITLTGVEEGEVELEFADEFMPEFSDPEGPEFFQLWLPDGTLLERSESLAGRDLPKVDEVLTQPGFHDIALSPGGRCRLVQLSFIPENETEDLDGELSLKGHEEHAMTVCLAMNRESFDLFLKKTQLAILGSFTVLLLLLLFFVKKALAYGLRPLEDLRGQVASLDPQHLESPIRLRKETTELMPVVDQLNTMLTRLREAMERERQFTSNVAHELRTPIAELRSIAEVGARILENPQATLRFFTDVREIAVEMELMVGNLLSLTRCDNGTQIVARARFDLGALLKKTWKRAGNEARQKQMDISFQLPERLWLESDEIMVEQIVQNLVNNAVAHGPVGSTLEVRAALDGEGLELDFRNSAPMLEQGDLKHLFDRFWQKDAARTGGQHAGLGLSLVSSFSKLLGFRIRASMETGGYFRIALGIPTRDLSCPPETRIRSRKAALASS